MKNFLLANLLILSPLSYAFTYASIDNLGSESPVYAQFFWRDKSGCNDTIDSSLFRIGIGESVVDQIYANAPYQGENSYYCNATMNIYSDVAGENLLAQEDLVWHVYSNDGGNSFEIELHSHDTPPRVCADGYGCIANATDGKQSFNLQITKYNKISFYNGAPYPVYATFYPGGYCNQTLSSNSVYTIEAKSEQALTNIIYHTQPYKICNVQIEINQDKQGSQPLCNIYVNATGSNLQNLKTYSWPNTNGYCNSLFLNDKHDFANIHFYGNS